MHHQRNYRIKHRRKQVRPWGWAGIDPVWGPVWSLSARRPETGSWRMSFACSRRGPRCYVGYDLDRKRFIIGDGTPCKRKPRWLNRIGWRLVAFK